jgi:tRNA-dependent cyclodipeptide synthase
MRIKTFLNCSEGDILSRRFNIFVGISLGNKYFSKENVRKYILWSLKYTRSDVLVFIADKNHAINYQVFNGYDEAKALEVALFKGRETCNMVEDIIRGLDKADLVKVCRWEDVEDLDKVKILYDEFKINPDFHDSIIKIVKDNLGAKAEKLNLFELEKLSEYVLNEMPILLGGISYGGRVYDFYPYPGLSSLDYLLMGLQDASMFPSLSKRLNIERKVARVEAYVD